MRKTSLRKKRIRWNEEDVETLRSFYPISSMDRLLKKLPNKTEKSIRMKAHSLNLNKDETYKKYTKYYYSEKNDIDFPQILDKRRGKLKQCRICKKWLPLDKFWVDESCFGGLYHECKDCNLKHDKINRLKNDSLLIIPRLFGIVFYEEPDNSNLEGDKIDHEKAREKAIYSGKECVSCHKILPIINFNVDNTTTGFSCYCKECLTKIRKNRDVDFVEITIKNTLNNGRREVTITREYLLNLLKKQNYRCALTGIKLKLSGKKKNTVHDPYLPSIDRIDNDKGYVLGNVRWTCWGANRMRYIWNDKTFYYICRKATEYSP